MTEHCDTRALADRAKQALRSGRTADAAAILRQARESTYSDAASLRTLADVALVLQDPATAAEFLGGAIAACAPEPAPAAWLRVPVPGPTAARLLRTTPPSEPVRIRKRYRLSSWT